MTIAQSSPPRAARDRVSDILGPRALGGGPLEGDRLLRLIYLDEAGVSHRKQETHLVVAGTIIHADKKLVAVGRHIEQIVRRYIPEEHQDGFVFHAHELFNGRGRVFDQSDPRWTLEKRLQIADELADIPRRFDLPITLGAIARSEFPFTFNWPPGTLDRDKTRGEYACAFMQCAIAVEYWMRREAASDEVCMLIAEDNDLVRSFIRDNQRHYQNPGVELSQSEKRYFPFKRIVEDPLFQPKRTNHPLQIADFCAYVYKRRLMNDRNYDRFWQALIPHVVIIDPDE